MGFQIFVGLGYKGQFYLLGSCSLTSRGSILFPCLIRCAYIFYRIVQIEQLDCGMSIIFLIFDNIFT